MNLKNIFEEILGKFGVSSDKIKIEWNFLLDSYIVDRRYHDVNHIIRVYKLLEPHFKTVEEADLFKLAILYHDIVYVPGSNRNEIESALLFYNRFENYLNSYERNVVMDLIRSTEIGSELHTYNEKLLHDADYVSGLGGSYEDFIINNNKIIQEYSLVYPEDMVNVGRKKFLIEVSKTNFIKTLEFKPFEVEIKNNIDTYLTQTE